MLNLNAKFGICSAILALMIAGCEPDVTEVDPETPSEAGEAAKTEAGSAADPEKANRLKEIDESEPEMPEIEAQKSSYEGTIKEISPTSISLDTGEGEVQQFAVDADVIIYRNDKEDPDGVSAVKTGDKVRLVTVRESNLQDGTIQVVSEIHLASGSEKEPMPEPVEEPSPQIED